MLSYAYPELKAAALILMGPVVVLPQEDPMVLLDFSITPLGEGESVSSYVARCVDLIDSSGLDYRLHSMGTIVEGELVEVLDLLKRCVEALSVDCHRISVSAKLDYRAGQSGRLTGKVERIEQQLGRTLKK
jgi:uncharacterized protein (TIGR00106 family)